MSLFAIIACSQCPIRTRKWLRLTFPSLLSPRLKSDYSKTPPPEDETICSFLSISNSPLSNRHPKQYINNTSAEKSLLFARVTQNTTPVTVSEKTKGDTSYIIPPRCDLYPCAKTNFPEDGDHSTSRTQLCSLLFDDEIGVAMEDGLVFLGISLLVCSRLVLVGLKVSIPYCIPRLGYLPFCHLVRELPILLPKDVRYLPKQFPLSHPKHTSPCKRRT